MWRGSRQLRCDFPFTGYTAVLIANSAIPVWQGARRSLPPLFIAASVASTGALLQLTESEPRALEIGRRLAVGGEVLELAAGEWMKRELALPEVRRPLQEGSAGRLWQASKVMGVAALGLSLLPARWRWAQRAAGVLGTAAVVATKLAVFKAGKASARNPHASFEMQRKGHGAAAVGPASTLVQLKVEGRPVMERAAPRRIRLGYRWRLPMLRAIRLLRFIAPAACLLVVALARQVPAETEGAQMAAPVPSTAKVPAAAPGTTDSAQQVLIGLYLQAVPEIDIKTNSFLAEFYMWFVWSGDIDPTLTYEFNNLVQPSEL